MTTCAGKACSSCSASKPLADFYRNASSPDGRHSLCKLCHGKRRSAWLARNADRHRTYQREYKRAEYAANGERIRARANAWRAAHPEIVKAGDAAKRQRRRSSPRVAFTGAQLLAKRAYWGNRCWICSGPDEAVDHVKPLAAGGPHMLANLRPVCTSCNSRKNKQWPISLEDLVAVKLTAPHPVYGDPGKIVKEDAQVEADLITAGYAVPSEPTLPKVTGKPAKAAGPAKPDGA